MIKGRPKKVRNRRNKPKQEEKKAIPDTSDQTDSQSENEKKRREAIRGTLSQYEKAYETDSERSKSMQSISDDSKAETPKERTPNDKAPKRTASPLTPEEL